MISRLPIFFVLAFALLSGQLASVWHFVEHLHPPQVNGHTHPDFTATDAHALHEAAHGSADSFGQRSASTGDWPTGTEGEQCLSYHLHAGQYAPLPTAPALSSQCVGGPPSAERQTVSTQTVRAHGYLIRGPPART